MSVQAGAGHERDEAVGAAGAAGAERRQHVGVTPDAAVVLTHTAAELHTAVERRADDDDRAARAGGVERLPLAVLQVTCKEEDTSQRICQSINQMSQSGQSLNRSSSQSINQSINQSVNQSLKQSFSNFHNETI